MTELAYMTYTDWAGGGTGMAAHGARIRKWLDGAPYVVLDPALDERSGVRPAGTAVVDSITPPGAERIVAGLSKLSEYSSAGQSVFDHAVVVLFPFDGMYCEMLREIIVGGRVRRIFVMVWSSTHLVSDMLDGLGAVNLFTGEKAPAPDGLQLAAAKAMVGEQYNGLGSGHGKDAVIQLLRAMGAEGYPLDERWIHALFASDATYRSAETVRKFLIEMNMGVKHRVHPRFVPDIVGVLRAGLRDPVDAA